MTIDHRTLKASLLLHRLEHSNFAKRLGLTEGTVDTIDEALLIEAIYAVDELSWSADGASLGVQLVALTWEHSDVSTRDALRPFLITALSRLGVSPSTAM